MDTLNASSSWPAPAKLNLFLHVVARRADGYHDLQTVFQLVDLCDRIRIEATPDGRIVREPAPDGEPPPTVDPAQDLVVRAALALQRFGGGGAGARITVSKHIPVGGGLGGGSSDAATVLVALNRLWNLQLGEDQLAQIGLTLGADVPVFVRGRSAWAEGRGERLRAMTLPPRWFLILHPRVSVSTREILQAPELTRNSPLLTIPQYLAGGARNDCEPVVRARYPAVAAALDWLASHSTARLTGTGSCIFAAFESAAAAAAVATQVPGQWSSWVARGLDVSPLHETLLAR